MTMLAAYLLGWSPLLLFGAIAWLLVRHGYHVDNG